jgi:hypothetical protein
MLGFPAVDPIPLPAPVWLFKLLHVVTLSLHFVAVQMMLGGLLVAILLNFFARKGNAATAAQALGRRLPVVMTFVINLAVPPLLFAQVLYGRALYTSSVLIGAWWISIILLLTIAYWLLYRFSAALDKGKSAWWIGGIAWLIIGLIARNLSSNMTLMLRPEVWQQMYSSSTVGKFLPVGDPTLVPRWLFMMAGGLVFSGLWMIFLSSRQAFEADAKRFFSRTGGLLALVGAPVQVAIGFWVYNTQPAFVQESLNSHLLYALSGKIWLALLALIFVVGLIAALLKTASPVLSWAALVVGTLASIAHTNYRDGLRDFTLLSKGYDVWARTIVTNWSVVILFLVLFVAGLGVIGWLLSVVARATQVTEKAA